MRTIIAGGRDVCDYSELLIAISRCGWVPLVVISGCARGADALGEKWADDRKIPLERFPADWNRYGNSAGPIRNREMADHADALIALWDGISPGTKNMIAEARARGLRVYVHRIVASNSTQSLDC